MSVLDNLKEALTLLRDDAPLRVQLADSGAIFQLSAAELMSALGVQPLPRRNFRVITPRLNIRSEPGLTGTIVDHLVQDTIFEVFDTTPQQADNYNWQRLADGRGWIAVDMAAPVDAPVTPLTPKLAVNTASAATSDWQLPFTAAQRGVGLSAGGWAPNTQQIELVRRNAIEFALICDYQSGQAATTITPLRNIGVKSFILRSCTTEKPTTSKRFIDLTLPILKEFEAVLGGSSPLIIAIGNEPNLTNEGWLSAWADGAGFAAWWNAVATAYRQHFAGAKLGFPALSPGSNVPGIRQNEEAFLAGAAEAVNNADWVGVHCYWTAPDGSDLAVPIDRWRRWFGSRPIIGTEVGPADSTMVTPDAIRRAYAAFAAVGVPACAWVLSGAGAWTNAAWDLHNIQL